MLRGNIFFHIEASEGGLVQRIVDTEDLFAIFLSDLWKNKCHAMNASNLSPEIRLGKFFEQLHRVLEFSSILYGTILERKNRRKKKTEIVGQCCLLFYICVL